MENEKAAVERAKRLFSSEHVNIRPASAARANDAVFAANLEPGDTVLGVNFSAEGRFNFIGYEIDAGTGRINYEDVFGLAFKHKPKLIAAGTWAYPRKMDFFQLQEVAEEVGARLLADMSPISGLVAAGLCPSPVPYADFVTTTARTLGGPPGGIIMCRGKYADVVDKAVSDNDQGEDEVTAGAALAAALLEAMSPEFKAYQEQTVKNARALAAGLTGHNFNLVTGGTDNHMIMVDLRSKGITGLEAEKMLGRAGMRVGVKSLPGEPGSFDAAGGILLSTPAVTAGGMAEEAMAGIAGIIDMVISHPRDEISLARARKLVADLCSRYLPGQTELEV